MVIPFWMLMVGDSDVLAEPVLEVDARLSDDRLRSRKTSHAVDRVTGGFVKVIFAT